MPVFSAAVLITGFCGMIAQLTLLRELLLTSQSNELSIGLTLANWLILEAAGAFLAGRLAGRRRDQPALFVALTVLFSAALPAAVFLARTWRTPFGVGAGEGVGLPQMFVASFLILLPVSATHGALFASASAIRAAASRHAAAGIGRVYALELAGTIAGGLAFTLLLATRLTAFQAAFGVSFLGFGSCALMTGFRPQELGVRTRLDRPLAAVCLLLAAASGYAALGSPATRLHEESVRRQYGEQQVVHYENSPYGNVTVVRREEQLTFFVGGVPAITTPTPDVAFVEEFAHLPLLFHPGAREVLVLGGGAGGVVRELLRHPVRRVDYAELDPLVLRLVERYPTPLTRAELGDPRVAVHHRDGRLFLKETPRRYDAILVGVGDPQDLQANRLFTREFFSLARQRLAPAGILALTVPGSATYVSRELRDLNACVANTLRSVFPAVRVIPGDGSTLLLASAAPGLRTVGPETIAARLRDADLPVSHLTPFLVEDKLDPLRARWFEEALAGGTRLLNEDFRPVAVYFSLAHWNALFSPRLQQAFARVEQLSLPPVVALIGVLGALLLLAARRMKAPAVLGVSVAVGTTGFAGMILELALIFTFQALSGVVFLWVGLLVTAFMAGTALGGYAATRLLERGGGVRRLFLAVEALLVAYAATLPLVFLALRPYLDHPLAATALHGLFLALSVVAGLLIGLEFPLAGKIRLAHAGGVGAAAGSLYAADLVGGWVGGIVGSVVLLPILGLLQTCVVVALLKVVSLLVVAATVGPASRTPSPG
jgi:spermidine synthase